MPVFCLVVSSWALALGHYAFPKAAVNVRIKYPVTIAKFILFAAWRMALKNIRVGTQSGQCTNPKKHDGNCDLDRSIQSVNNY